MLSSKTVKSLTKSMFYEQVLVNLRYALYQVYTSNMVWNTLVSELAAYLPHISWVGVWEYKVRQANNNQIPDSNILLSTNSPSRNTYLQLVSQVGLERDSLFYSILDKAIEPRAIRENRNQFVSQVRHDPDYQAIEEETRSLLAVVLDFRTEIRAVLTAESHQPAAFDIKDEVLFIGAGQLALAKLKEIEYESRT